MLALMSVLMSHTSLHFFVSSFVLGCAYACVASVNQALVKAIDLRCPPIMQIRYVLFSQSPVKFLIFSLIT